MVSDIPSTGESPFDRAVFARDIGEFCVRTLRLSSSTRILVAVSGGADSVALYHVLRELGYTVEIAHFDHVTRGGASARDAAFVAALAAADGVPCHTERADVAADAYGGGESFEMRARSMRYAFLARTAHLHGCTHIATGHHADDQAETVLMRVLRGTTGKGLAGIPAVRELAGVRLVRPLLRTRRETILRYLHAIGADHREDVTNGDEAILRNRVRHGLIPQLAREYNPQVVDALCRLAENQRVENAWVDAEAERAASLAIRHGAIDRLTFAAMPEALRRRVFQIYAWRLGVDCGFDRVVAGVVFVTEGRAGAKFDVGSGVCLINGATVAEVAASAGHDATDEVGLTAPGSTVAFNRTFVVCMRESLPETPLADYCTPCRQVFDTTSVHDLAVRRVRAGDRFRPFGMQGTRKLSDYLTDLKLTPSERAAQLVLTSAGQILWVVGRGLSAEAAVSARTRRVLEVEVVPSDF